MTLWFTNGIVNVKISAGFFQVERFVFFHREQCYKSPRICAPLWNRIHGDLPISWYQSMGNWVNLRGKPFWFKNIRRFSSWGFLVNNGAVSCVTINFLLIWPLYLSRTWLVGDRSARNKKELMSKLGKFEKMHNTFVKVLSQKSSWSKACCHIAICKWSAGRGNFYGFQWEIWVMVERSYVHRCMT